MICIKSKTFLSLICFCMYDVGTFDCRKLDSLMNLFIFNQFYVIGFLIYKSFNNIISEICVRNSWWKTWKLYKQMNKENIWRNKTEQVYVKHSIRPTFYYFESILGILFYITFTAPIVDLTSVKPEWFSITWK